MKEFRDKLHSVIKRHLPFNDPQDDLEGKRDLMDLGLDSMSLIDLLLDLEKTFDIIFPESMLVGETFRNAASLEAAVATLIEEPRSEDLPKWT